MRKVRARWARGWGWDELVVVVVVVVSEGDKEEEEVIWEARSW